MLIGYPVAFALAANGLMFGFIAIYWAFFDLASRRDPGAALRQHARQRLAARDSILHVHGRDPRTVRDGRGHARLDGAAVRPDSRRPRLLGDHRRRSFSVRSTGTVAAQVIAMGLISLPVMMRYEYNMRTRRRTRGIGHDHAARAAVAGADRAGRPARKVGGRHVSRRLGPFAAADSAVRPVHIRRQRRQAGVGPGSAQVATSRCTAGRCGRNACGASSRRRC